MGKISAEEEYLEEMHQYILFMLIAFMCQSWNSGDGTLRNLQHIQKYHILESNSRFTSIYMKQNIMFPTMEIWTFQETI